MRFIITVTQRNNNGKPTIVKYLVDEEHRHISQYGDVYKAYVWDEGTNQPIGKPVGLNFINFGNDKIIGPRQTNLSAKSIEDFDIGFAAQSTVIVIKDVSNIPFPAVATNETIDPEKTKFDKGHQVYVADLEVPGFGNIIDLYKKFSERFPEPSAKPTLENTDTRINAIRFEFFQTALQLRLSVYKTSHQINLHDDEQEQEAVEIERFDEEKTTVVPQKIDDASAPYLAKLILMAHEFKADGLVDQLEIDEKNAKITHIIQKFDFTANLDKCKDLISDYVGYPDQAIETFIGLAIEPTNEAFVFQAPAIAVSKTKNTEVNIFLKENDALIDAVRDTIYLLRKNVHLKKFTDDTKTGLYDKILACDNAYNNFFDAIAKAEISTSQLSEQLEKIKIDIEDVIEGLEKFDFSSNTTPAFVNNVYYTADSRNCGQNSYIFTLANDDSAKLQYKDRQKKLHQLTTKLVKADLPTNHDEEKPLNGQLSDEELQKLIGSIVQNHGHEVPSVKDDVAKMITECENLLNHKREASNIPKNTPQLKPCFENNKERVTSFKAELDKFLREHPGIFGKIEAVYNKVQDAFIHMNTLKKKTEPDFNEMSSEVQKYLDKPQEAPAKPKRKILWFFPREPEPTPEQKLCSILERNKQWLAPYATTAADAAIPEEPSVPFANT